MLHKTTAIVFHTTAYSNTAVIAKLYTREFGLQGYLVNSVRSSRAKNKNAYFQPLTLLDLVVYHNPAKGLQRISQIEYHYHFSRLPFQTLTSAQALFIAEVLYRTIREEESNPVLFDFIRDSVIFLDHCEESLPDFHLIFMLKLAAFLGFSPSANYSSENCYFSLSEGVFTKSLSAPALLSAENSELLYRCMNAHYDQTILSHHQRQIMLESVIQYYAYHLPSGFNLQSLPVLSQIFM
ncbi:MAG: DNA repair protein RecO [Bacteroidetes bacterium]|nr:DNA repair protein RecO [Bacteroidota bacterium]